jgi:Leucine-rich repeat (LRR) protein
MPYDTPHYRGNLDGEVKAVTQHTSSRILASHQPDLIHYKPAINLNNAIIPNAIPTLVHVLILSFST